MPIIIVSARDQDKEKVTALDDGADDYLTKPFSATELMARIRVVLRHYYRMNQKEEVEKPDDAVYTNGEMVMVRIRRFYVLSWHRPEERSRIILQNRSTY